MNISTVVPHAGGNNQNNPGAASRQRLRWTNELHERFVDAVTQLGGPDSKYYILMLIRDSKFACNALRNSFAPSLLGRLGEYVRSSKFQMRVPNENFLKFRQMM